MALFSDSGTFGSTSIGGIGVFSTWSTIIEKALSPSNGFFPVISSYSTAPSE